MDHAQLYELHYLRVPTALEALFKITERDLGEGGFTSFVWGFVQITGYAANTTPSSI
jgi:hypothetical protein